ncbi:cytochrome C assembly protein [Gordonibacter sp. An230]|uniref:heme lyase CcmF/NrfE family subunit n=1 Tax=Gordonibacter sp. An230 TaxID=1965592 RepID=UPI000B3944A3|nr:cytochrome c biogenesis protein CcsA [Gordonibacter sp. An230]OUO88974.1 cytochrome C assembly protein [Gordonibacter sp. An230]
MSTFGLIGLLVAFAGVAVSVVCLVAGALMRKRKRDLGETLTWAGHVAVFLSFAGLTACCGILVYCFMTGNMTIEYVLDYHSDASGDLAWLYKLAGLWAGRQGSLLFWAWLIAAFNAVVAARNLKGTKRLDSMALLVSQVVLAAFVCVLLFSESNMPFTATAAKYFDASGNLTAAASTFGMNTLLEHWAMAIHPPTLFVGYAGLTIPFAYAIAALIVNDSSKEWVVRSQRYALFSWLFLGVGIGLGAVWAYVVLGWGGYWGWDPVENASLLSWLVGVALIHSFTVYRQRGAFKRWSVMCACLTFAFVIVGTFISRSGLVQSVHAFEGDNVSLVLFGGLIGVSVLAGIVGLAVRWRSFGPVATGSDDVESMVSKDAAYYFNNVIMVVFTLLLTYLTVASALPSWLPLGGQTVSTGTYDAIARPLGVVYLAILAVCPLLSWSKTEGKQFWKRARIPGACALVLFAMLMVYFAMYLLPSYNANLEYYSGLAVSGDQSASDMLGVLNPSWYYNGLAVVGFLVASLLFFNSLFVLGRAIRGYRKGHGGNAFAAAWGMLVNRASTFGGFVAHLGMAVILVGLIGSSMYVTERVGYIDYDEETDTVAESFAIQDFTLSYAGNSVKPQDNGDDILYTVRFDVQKDGQPLGTVEPTVQLVQSTQQQKLVASVISFPTEDLFVVYRGVNTEGDFSMDVRVNPLISFVWAGFFLLMAGVVVSTFGRRGAKRKLDEEPSEGGLSRGASTAKGEDSSVVFETVVDVVTADGVVEAAVKGAVDVALGSAPAAAASKADEKKREEA